MAILLLEGIVGISVIPAKLPTKHIRCLGYKAVYISMHIAQDQTHYLNFNTRGITS